MTGPTRRSRESTDGSGDREDRGAGPSGPDVEAWCARVDEAVRDHEFATFLLGVSVPKTWSPGLADRMKRRWKQTMGLALEEHWPGRLVDFEDPELRIVLAPLTGDVRLQPRPLFVYGRYLKDCRDISQCRWHCQACHGQGCPRCGGTGHRYQMTVEEAVGRPLRERTGAVDSQLHGAGREDVDARMLGRGRPFVMTLRDPRRRHPDLAAAAAETPVVSEGRVRVRELRLVDKALIRTVTRARGRRPTGPRSSARTTSRKTPSRGSRGSPP
jgi:tRNA pseudouridine synthase 10